jgi:predicted short-subunit dehydrogenase-like oxidoreductase (DUF2520 family)
MAAKLAAVVVGFGRLGAALAGALKRRGIAVTVSPVRKSRAGFVRKSGFSVADAFDFKRATWCFLTVPDAAIAQTAQRVLPLIGSQTAVVHCSGALSLAVFGSVGARLGSFHPLVAVSEGETTLEGHSAAVAANSPTLRKQLFALAKKLGMHPLLVSEKHRAAYHAAAVLSAGLLLPVIHAATLALKHAGLTEQQALSALLPLAHSALRGVEKKGLRKGMTGPLVRGDVDTIARHLAALPQPVKRLYQTLSLQAFSLLGPKSAKKDAAVLDLLKESRS